MRTFTKIIINGSTLRVVPELSYMLCEACGKEIRIADAYSYPAVMALSGSEIPISAACDEEQHFGCSHECALKLHNQCINEHIMTKFNAALAQHRQEQAIKAAQQSAREEKGNV